MNYLSSELYKTSYRNLMILANKYRAIEATQIMSDRKFQLWTASSRPEKHHYGVGGLVIHTHEVVNLALSSNRLLGADIDETELFLACLFHDVGKIYDYAPTDKNVISAVDIPHMTDWYVTEHKNKIHHIARSALIWNQLATYHGRKQETIDNVLHAILAHHGLQEWGSPVTPKDKLAWMLYLCDSISARMNDAEK